MKNKSNKEEEEAMEEEEVDAVEQMEKGRKAGEDEVGVYLGDRH